MSKKRGNGEGSIYYSDKLNRWVGQFSNGLKTDGTVNRKSVYGKTRKEVADKITKALNGIKERTFVDKSTTTFLEILESLVEEKHKSNITSDSTYKRDTYAICQIVNSSASIAKKPIQKITNQDIKRFFFSITHYSNSTIDKIYRFVNSTFRKAVSQRYIYSNPLDDRHEIIKPKSDKPDKKVEALTVDEHRKLLDVLNNQEVNSKYRNIILLILSCGLRVGEALSLDKDKHIDFDSGYLLIRRTLTRNSNDIYAIPKYDKAKTYNSIRDIKIIDDTKEILKSCLNDYTGNCLNLLFWDKDNNKIVTPAEINFYLKRICKKYEITGHIHTHMLRHTYATRCIESGMSPVVLSKKLGHKDISVTLNTYTSVFAKYEDTQDDRYINYMEEKKLVALKLH